MGQSSGQCSETPRVIRSSSRCMAMLWKGAAASVIGVEDLRRLRPRILHALDRGFFEARYARGSARERELLRLIARHGESATLRQLSADSGLMNNQVASPGCCKSETT